MKALIAFPFVLVGYVVGFVCTALGAGYYAGEAAVAALADKLNSKGKS